MVTFFCFSPASVANFISLSKTYTSTICIKKKELKRKRNIKQKYSTIGKVVFVIDMVIVVVVVVAVVAVAVVVAALLVL